MICSFISVFTVCVCVCRVHCGSDPQLCVCVSDELGSAGSALSGSIHSAVQPAGGTVALRTEALLEGGCVSGQLHTHTHTFHDVNMSLPVAVSQISH